MGLILNYVFSCANGKQLCETSVYVGIIITLSFFFKLILVCSGQLKYKEYLT